LYSDAGAAPLLEDAKKTNTTGTCAPCKLLFENPSGNVNLTSTFLGNITDVSLPDTGADSLPENPDGDGSHNHALPPNGVLGGAARPLLYGGLFRFVLVAMLSYIL
jgi:hypothetical protein